MSERIILDIKEEFPVEGGKLCYWASSESLRREESYLVRVRKEQIPNYRGGHYVYACPESYELFHVEYEWEKEWNMAQAWFEINMYIQNIVALACFHGLDDRLITLNIREYRMWLGKFQIEDCEDAREAYKLRKGAEQGILNDQTHLGTRYYKGCGVVKDEKEAVKWYSKAAEQGHYWAEYNLGYMYYSGAGVKKDLGEAAKWWRKAAKMEDGSRVLTMATDALAEL